MTKLIVCYMIENDQDVFQLSYDSIKDVADHVVIVDGNAEQGYRDDYANEKTTVLEHKFPHDNKGAIGIQKNVYLKHIQEHFPNDWCLVLDADEVVDERVKVIKHHLNINGEEGLGNGIFNPHMRHLIQDLAHEDSTIDVHHVPGRLFKITDDLFYPESEHCVLQSKKRIPRINYNIFTIWHLGYAREMMRLKKKYLNHMDKSEVHNKDYLRSWYMSHLTGQYPKTNVSLLDLPKVMKDFFLIDDDELYFSNRGIEVKHSLMVKQWNDYFKPKEVMELGCGRGPYLHYWQWFVEDACGIELSQWAIDHAFAKNIVIGNITKNSYKSELITAIDVFEHLTYKGLDHVLSNLTCEKLLISVPVIGDPNLENDPTHIIKETMEWWHKKIESFGFVIKDTPEHWLYKEQLIVAEVKR